VKNFTFLVVGGGSIGQRHIGNLLATGCKNVIAVEPNVERRRAIESNFQIATSPSIEEAPPANVAFITAPNSLHVPLALQAARRGCHLFIEKPLSHLLEGVAELKQIAREKKLKTLVACNLRFHPALQKIKSLLNEGAIGKWWTARIQFGLYLPDWHPTEDYRKSYSARNDLGGGIILDAIHEIDYARWLFGHPTEVAGMCGHVSDLELQTEDLAALLLRDGEGRIVEIHLDYLQRSYRRACEIIGATGTILWDFQNKFVEIRRSKGAAETHELPASWEVNQMYIDELAHFLAVLNGAEDSCQTLEEGEAVLRIALAAKESNQSRKFVALSA
jgi:predicted dehydrogenase